MLERLPFLIKRPIESDWFAGTPVDFADRPKNVGTVGNTSVQTSVQIARRYGLQSEARCGFQPTLEISGVFFGKIPSPTGRGWRIAPGEGSPPHDHDSAILKIVGRAALIRRCCATFSQREKDCCSYLGQLCSWRGTARSAGGFTKLRPFCW
jgi:hypothetical protein